jgi:polyisoprenyl-teichoic acid--peptidoglycan teichoic acid transferase
MQENNSPNPTDTKQQRKRLIIAVVVATVLALLILPAVGLLVLGLLGVGRSPSASQEVDQTAEIVLPQDVGGLSLPAITPGTPLGPTPTPMPPWQGNSRINILLLGIDQRPKANPNRTRTDTMIILTLDPSTHTAGMLSIPRDLYVPLPNGVQDRINAAHVYGGPSYAMRTVEANFGMPIQHYVRVNFNVVTTLVDLVGGIDVYVDKDINDPWYPNDSYGYDPFVISKGMHHMDGVTALKYARTRHGSSDFFRMRRQQQIIMALRDRVLSTDAITKLLPNAPAILSTLSNSISTDLSFSEILQLMMAAKDLPTDKIKQVVVDETAVHSWTTPQGAEVQLAYRIRLPQLAAQLYSLAATTTPAPTATPDIPRIAIQNGTLTRGLAGTTQSYLQKKGFNVTQVSDAKGEYPASVIIDYRGRNHLAQQLATALGLPASAISQTLTTNSKVDVLVILGDDYQPMK